jgi:cob(I)alamin adenosyltransferase
MKIYTKRGDRGTTSLFGGKRVKKSHKVIEAIGTIDELIAWLGILHLQKIQCYLMEISSAIAKESRILNPESGVQELEQEIDRMQSKLPELHNFILPRNNIHIARAVCRRAERRIMGIPAGRSMGKYLNRLSDYLFVLARYEDFKKGKKEVIWKNEGRKLLEKVRQRD